MNIYSLEKILSELYNFATFEDYCKNGLQVEGSLEVEKVLLAVSFNQKVIEKAKEIKADTIIVHHGIFGKNYFFATGAMHLIGPTGFISSLEVKGYSVKKLE